MNQHNILCNQKFLPCIVEIYCYHCRAISKIYLKEETPTKYTKNDATRIIISMKRNPHIYLEGHMGDVCITFISWIKVYLRKQKFMQFPKEYSHRWLAIEKKIKLQKQILWYFQICFCPLFTRAYLEIFFQNFW